MTALIAATLIILLASAAPVAAATPKLPGQIARQITALRTCQTALGLPRAKARSPWVPHTTAYRRWQLNLWTNRLRACQAALNERKRQWDWQAWLPDKWQRIGACETGYGQRPGNWQHNSGTYQGAFGFYHGSWDAFKLPGYPEEAYQATPWQQYQVALAIYRRYGLTGWGCRGA